MKNISQRVFLVVMAVLFLGTAAATGIAVIFASSNSQTNNQQSNNSKNTGGTHLQGTKLAGFTPVSNVSNLQIQDIKVGNGPVATASSTVSVLYTGAVASTGIIFQASTDNSPSPVQLPLAQTIPGWQQGIAGMKVGGTRRILIPASLAYGSNPPQGSGIPPNAPLVFDVTLLGVQQ